MERARGWISSRQRPTDLANGYLFIFGRESIGFLGSRSRGCAQDKEKRQQIAHARGISRDARDEHINIPIEMIIFFVTKLLYILLVL
jgi:hypothetical protein